MNDFEKIIVTNIDTFQFKPEVDMMLVTEIIFNNLNKSLNNRVFCGHRGRNLR